jgi:transcriptional regulator with XRE-family HTH domain
MAMLKVDEIARSRGYSQARLSMESRVNPSVLSRYWHNQVRAVSLDILEALARVLGVEVTDLISNDARP